MSERIDPQASNDIAGIALSMAPNMTSGEILAALHRAWKAGYSHGFEIGMVKGQRHVADIMDNVYKSMGDQT